MPEAFNTFSTDDSESSNFSNSFDPDINFFNKVNVGLSSCQYYNESDFHNVIESSKNREHFSIIHINIRSLPKNYDQLSHYLSSLNHEFLIIALTETWLTNMNHDSFNMPFYTSVHSFRKERVGGGASLLVNSKYDFKLRNDLALTINENEIESVFIELISCSLFGGKNVIIGCIYRPPDSNINHFNDAFAASLDVIGKEGKLCFIQGDFNIDLVKSESHAPSTDFINLLYSSYFYPVITKPTRMTSSSATLIDNIVTNSIDYASKPGVLFCDISDHFPIFHITFSQANVKNHRDTSSVSFRRFNVVNTNRFKMMIKEANWDNVYNCKDDADLAYLSFFQIFKNIFDYCFPLVSSNPKRTRASKPWFSSGLLKSSIKKHKLYKKYLSNPTQSNEDVYKKYKNKYTHLIRIAKKKYYTDKFINSANDIKATWIVIKELLNKNNSTMKLPAQFTNGDRLFTSPLDIANGFNYFFSKIGHSLAKTAPPSKECPTENIQACFPPLSNFDPPTCSEVLEIINNLNNSAAGHDEIKVQLLKEIASSIIMPLTHVFAVSLNTGVVPNDLKIAKVLPLFKEGDPTVFNNYRPISILPCFSKIIEKLVYVRILNHLNANNILYKHQYGFRKKHSTYMALVQLTEKIHEALHENKFAIGIFIDLSKAFDTVDHTILLLKLKRYGYHDTVLNWLRDYLYNRQQYVSIDGVVSSKMGISHGVPQGSILGPLLFLIFINDFGLLFDTALPIIFADDTNIVFSHSNFNSLIMHGNSILEQTSRWFQMNRLSLNINKTNYMVFRHINKNYSKDDSKLFINNIEIQQVSHTKFLGVIVDEALSWKNHVEHVCKKNNKILWYYKKDFISGV